VKAVDAHTSTKQAEKFKEALSARRLMASVFWDRKECCWWNSCDERP
jgi:hypothetical protein